MKLTLVSPELPFSGRVPMVPPILEYLGGLTSWEMPDAELRLVDANQTPLRPEDMDGDLVGLSTWTATAPWVYRFADRCRELGKRVILGGIHATALPEEAARHADAVVVGEAESVWGTVLHDARHGRLARRYDGARLPLDGLVSPVDARLPGRYRFRAFFTMRGCPHTCTFCSVHAFFGRSIRYRPVDEVAAEVEALAGGVWFNGDDNIWGAHPDRAVRLFDALAAGTPRSWYGFGDLRSVQGPDGARMLAAARRSGLFSVWAGWESDSPGALGDYRAEAKQGSDRVAAVKRLQDAGIEVVLFMVLGGREESPDSFRRALDLADRLRVGLHPVLLTPLPGTPLHEAYRPHLLDGLGWEAFTGARAVFQHPDPAMTPRAREAAYHALSGELFRPSRIARRLAAIPLRAFPRVHLLSLAKQLPMRRALAKARAAWEAENPTPDEEEPASLRRPHAPLEEKVAVLNAFVHDVATGTWIGTLVLLQILHAEGAGPAWAQAIHLVNPLERKFLVLTWVSLGVILLTGVVRMITWKVFGWTGDVAARRKRLLAVKHAILGLVFAAGTAWQVALALH